MPDYQKKTVAELTEILKGRSLPHSGKKADLIARLNEADKAAAPSEAAPEPTPTTEPVVEARDVGAEPPPSKATGDGPTTAQTLETTSTLAPPQPAPTSREGSATTDTKLASAVDRSIGLTASSVDEELKKRKARAERFGTAAATTTEPTAAESDAEALKALERARRFGTGETAQGTGVGKLDEALPMERQKRGKRGLEESGYDDPGLRQGRGGKRRLHGRGGRDNNRRGERPEGVKKQSTSVSERDRAAAEARKKRFAAS